MKWTDIHKIAMALEDHHGNLDILSLRFTDLRRFVLDLPDFSGNPEQCNEKILEAIQMAWLDERD